MSAANLKIELINKTTQLKENHVIEEIKRLLDFELQQGFFKLTAKQQARILEAKEEYKAGKILSENQANKKIQEWLTK